MSHKKINTILYICFFLSGVSGLIYEVLWAKYLALIFGNTAYAHTLVLATFMGGLALGSFFLGKFADKVKDRLAFYAWIEIGIAAFCVFTPELFKLSKNIYIIAAKNLSLIPIGIVAIKFIIGALIILPPTILMGGTLPILSRFIVRSLSVRGETVARLYYINSFGAVAGTLWAGFYLIYHFGLAFSITIAALINFAVGATVLILRNFYKTFLLASASQQAYAYQKEDDSYKEEDYSAKIIRISLAAIFLSGFVAMLYEVVWIRLLSLVLGTSAYSFSLMLAAFISGITIGSWLISKFMPKSRLTFLFFGLCEILIGISLIFSLPLYEKLPFLFLRLSGVFVRTSQTFLFYSTIKFFLSFLVMLVPTIFLGMTLPLVSKIASQRIEFLGRKVGGVFAFNTLGNILGALVSGLVLLPLFGLKHTLEFGIIINLFLGIIILFADKIFILRKKFAFTSICCLVFISYKLIVPDWNKIYFSAQIFRNPGKQDNFYEFSKRFKDEEVLFYRDGIDATASVVRRNNGELILYINGKADASSTVDMPAQVLSAQLPLLMKPQAKNILVVGLGSGATCGSALLHPIQSLDLVEISSSVVEANKYFTQFTYNALQDKRLQLYQEDARTFLQRTEKKYDIIISEPSNPWTSGSGALFTVEFFKDCLSRLNKGGLMAQWVQAYEMDDETFKMILQTFCSIFPEVTVWGTGVPDIILIGSNEKMVLDFNESQRRISQESIKADLSKIKLHDLFTLLSLQLASNETVQNSIDTESVVNSDYFPILDYKAPLALYTQSFVKNFIVRLDERSNPLEDNSLFIKNYLKHHRINDDDLSNLFKYISEKPTYSRNLLFALTKKWHEEYPKDREAILAYTQYNLDSLENAILVLEKLIIEDREYEYLERYVSLLIRKYWRLRSFFLPDIFSETIEKLKMCIDLSEDKKAKFYYILGSVFFSKNDYSSAIHYYTKAEELITSNEDTEPEGLNQIRLLKDISFTYFKLNNLSKAQEYANKLIYLDKDNSFAKSLIEYIKM